MTKRWASAGLVIVTVVAVAGVIFGVRIPVASAHARLVASVPTANAVLETAPVRILLDFDEDIETSLASIRLYDQRGAEHPVGDARRAGDASVIAADVSGLGSGAFVVVWRVASVDGHVVDGAFAFQVGTAQGVDTAALIDRVRAGTTVAPGVSRVAGVMRLASMLGVIAALGGGCWVALSTGPGAGAPRTRRLLWVSAVVALVGGVGVWAWFGVRLRAGSVTDGFTGLGLGDALTTRTGQLYLLRIGAAVVWMVLIGAIRDRQATWWRSVGLVSALVALVSFSATGHPNATRPASLWIGLDLVHLASVAVWAGGLMLFAVGGAPWFSDAEEPTMRRFSSVAVWAVPAIVVTGVSQTLKLSGGLDDLTASAWGRYLVSKLVVVVVVVAIGGVSRWALHHAGPSSIRRTVGAEAVLSVAVVALAAGLVAVPPHAGPPSKAFSATLSQADLIVDVNVGPGQVGSNEIHVVITPPGGSLKPVAGVRARAALAERSIPNSPLTLERLGPNHYSGVWVVPAPGSWKLQLIIETTPGSSSQLTATVEIPG